MGLWHGIIAPISFIVSLFNDSVAMYAVNNTADGTISVFSGAVYC